MARMIYFSYSWHSVLLSLGYGRVRHLPEITCLRNMHAIIFSFFVGLEDSKQAVVIRECCMNLLTRYVITIRYIFPSILGIASHMTGDELYGGRLYALHAFGAQLFKSCDPSFRGATIFLLTKKQILKYKVLQV